MAEAWDGRPERPEEDGWHWLRTPDDQEAPYEWRAAGECERGRWGAYWVQQGENDWQAKDCAYIAPCLTPAAVAAEIAQAVAAEREGCLAKCAEALLFYRQARAEAVSTSQGHIAERMHAAVLAVENDIRARGGTDALAEVRAQARREGIERALAAADRYPEENVCERHTAYGMRAAIRALIEETSRDAE